jgi:hypothetical protein
MNNQTILAAVSFPAAILSLSYLLPLNGLKVKEALPQKSLVRGCLEHPRG